MANAPRTLQQLANMEIATRSDFAAFCAGVDNIGEQLSLIIAGAHDELYMRLAANGGANMSARAKARRALRPLAHLATSARVLGRLGPRTYRIYARHYADEIEPQRRARARFDHTK